MQSAMNLGYPLDKILIIQRAFLETNMLNTINGKVEGHVLNGTAPLNKATVKLENKATGAVYETTTDANGKFEIEVQVGDYTNLELQLKRTRSNNTGNNDNKKPEKNDLNSAKVAMENLKNYSYDVKMIAKTGYMDIETTMNCKEDRESKITYCSSSTMGVDTESYLDYANGYEYSKVSSMFYSDSDEWTKVKISQTTSNSWIDMSSYLSNVNEERVNGGVVYKGKIDGSKISDALASTESDYSGMVSGDINIEMFVNSNNYIESINFTMYVMGMEEVVEVRFKDFNETGTISLPAELR